MTEPLCRRHDWQTLVSPIDGIGDVGDTICRRCYRIRDEAASLRGKRSQRRGKRIQRQRIVALGGENIGGSVPGLDGIGLGFRFESKSGAAFSERYWRWLRAIPATANDTRVLIVSSADGPGRKARAYVVVEFDDWRALHGGPK